MNGINFLGIYLLSPYYLLLLILLPLVLWLYSKGTKSVNNNIISANFPKNGIFSIFQKYTGITLIGMIYLVIVIILSDPNLPDQKQEITKKGIDIGIVLDVSYSMNAVDLIPNRLTAAKSVLTGFIGGLQTDRVGLVVFAGKPFTSCPLTFDYEIIKEITTNLTVDTIDQTSPNLQGTAIGDGILAGINLFKDSKDREKVLVLITDGSANVGVQPDLASKMAKEKGIKIFTIGIGSKEGSYIQLPGPFGRTIRQQVEGVDENTLKQLANIGDGKYYRAMDNKSLQDVFSDISKLQKKEIKVDVNTEYLTFYEPFIYALIVLFLIYLFYLGFLDKL